MNEDIFQRYIKESSPCSDEIFAGLKIDGIDLSGMTFDKVDFSGCHFINCDMREVTFSN